VKNKLSSEFNRWKKDNDQHGGQAFSRFVMLKFLDGLQITTNDFIFKGGNLLWHYIKTPRETIDLDLVTETLNSHLKIRHEIETSFQFHDEIEFRIKEFKEIDGEIEIGSAIILEFKTVSGQRNQFSIDIVYALPTDISIINSTVSGVPTKSASIENIIADKLSASHKFRSGNTRMKDFDDLWRISHSQIKINSKKLKKILIERNISVSLEDEWVSYLEESWSRHSKMYKDIPKDLSTVFDQINKWMNKLLS